MTIIIISLQVEYHNVVINVSPIDRGHCLFVPNPKLCLPQVRKNVQ